MQNSIYTFCVRLALYCHSFSFRKQPPYSFSQTFKSDTELKIEGVEALCPLLELNHIIIKGRDCI